MVATLVVVVALCVLYVWARMLSGTRGEYVATALDMVYMYYGTQPYTMPKGKHTYVPHEWVAEDWAIPVDVPVYARR